MTIDLLDLPDELLVIIVFKVISGEWRNDVGDFLSFASTCRRLRKICNDDEKYWKKMVVRRDPTSTRPIGTITWKDYCKQIYLMRTIPMDELENNISRFDENYFCTIEKLFLWPDKIRLYIDERGNYSLGTIQDPKFSKIAFVHDDESQIQNSNRISVSDSQFSVEDDRSQYLGCLDFAVTMSSDHIGKTLVFTYGFSGYSTTRLFQLEQTFIDKHNLFPLIRQCQNVK